MSKSIQLTKGFVALVDDDDYDALMVRKWQARISRSGAVYAQCKKYVGDYKYETVHMHRVLCDVAANMDVDHINRDTLDNRRANLRACTRGQNLANSRPTSACGYRGVYKPKGNARWVARVCKDGATAWRGWFATAEEAARGYDVAAREVHGEFAYQNFPVP